MKNSKAIIANISNMEDINKLKTNNNIKYINLDIENPNLEVIYYLIEHGQEYSYAEKLSDNKGYIYVSYDIFKQAELFILEVINKIPVTLNELEIARYLYITIGKNISYDINILPDKNETFNLSNVSLINNIWGSTYYGKGTNISLTKLYLYLCKLANIECSTIITSQTGYLKNIITIQNSNIVTDITQDIPYIQANFKTKNFLGFNDNIELDKKIGYINEKYNEQLIEKSLRNLKYDNDIIFNILENTSKIIDIKSIRPIELKIIYENIFSKYCPNCEVSFYNLYMNNQHTKNHFILIEYNNIYYSFNYTKNKFIKIDEKEIIENINENRIGIYLNEKIPFLNNKTALSLT